MSGERVKLDISCLDQGYVAVSAFSSTRLKFQVVKDEETYNYNLPSDGTPGIFPLQCGNGNYRFRVMENVVDKKYAELYSLTCNVMLEDEFQPFLRPSTYVPYTRESECVLRAETLAQEAGTPLEFVRSVYELVCGTVTYDKKKAGSVQSGYLPVPDETLETGMGICFDYAALTPYMLTIDKLRSYGANVEEGLARCMNNEAFYLKLVNMAVDDAGFERLRTAVESDNQKESFEAAHALKGMLGNLSLTPLFTPASELTEMLRAEGKGDAAELWGQIEEQRNRLLALRDES